LAKARRVVTKVSRGDTKPLTVVATNFTNVNDHALREVRLKASFTMWENCAKLVRFKEQKIYFAFLNPLTQCSFCHNFNMA
jgi:hypothetical protein